MDTCVIFCAGGFAGLAEAVDGSDLLIAADGGLRHMEGAGLRPDVILGDFDSLGYVPTGASVFPTEKDDTDAMLAVRLGLERGFRRFVLYGSLDGPRLDHTLANLQTLLFLAERGAAGYLVGLRDIAAVLRPGTHSFPKTAEGLLSLFCMGSDAEGVTLKGLKYPLQNALLTSGFPLGVSNAFTGETARITVRRGALIALYGRKNGFPTGGERP